MNTIEKTAVTADELVGLTKETQASNEFWSMAI